MKKQLSSVTTKGCNVIIEYGRFIYVKLRISFAHLCGKLHSGKVFETMDGNDKFIRLTLVIKIATLVIRKHHIE